MSLLAKLRNLFIGDELAKLRLEVIALKFDCENAKQQRWVTDERNRQLVLEGWELKTQLTKFLAADLARLSAEDKALKEAASDSIQN